MIRTAAALTLAAGLVASVSTGVAAQSAEWSATLVVPAFPSPYVSQWEQNPRNAFLTLVYTGTAPREYRLEAELRGSDLGLLGRATSPTRELAAGPTTEVITGAAVWDWDVRAASSEVVERALRAGVIPEGDYELCVRALSPQDLQFTEACAAFTTVLPDAPELLYPAGAATVSAIQPTFQWTPVSVPPSLGTLYRFTLVERYEHQTPATALRSNVPIHEAELQAPVLVYPADAIPLEDGTEYVWQVAALDGSGEPLGPTGLESQIRTFRVARDEVTVLEDSIVTPDTIPLIPDLARITGAASTEVERTRTGHRFEGTAWLELASPYRARVRVRLQGLETRGTGSSLVVTGGRAVADVDGATLGLDPLPAGVSLTELTYTPGDGLGGRARLELEGTRIRADGRLDVTAGGVYGTLTAAGRGTLFALGEDPVALDVTRAEVRLPDGGISLGGALTLFGEPAGCGAATAAVVDGEWRTRVACTPGVEISVDGTDGALSAELRAVSGRVSYDLEQGTADYDLSVDAGVRLSGPSGPVCTTVGTMAVRPSGVTVTEARSSCPTLTGPIRLGWLEVELQDLRVEELGVTPAGGLDVTLLMDLTPSLPALPDVPLPRLEDVAVSGDGIEVGSVEEPVIPVDAGAAGYGLRVARAVTNGFTLDWSDWSAGRAGEAAFNLGASLLMPQLSNAPGCFGAVGGSLESVTLRGGRLDATLTGEALPQPCLIDLAGGVADVELSLERIGGSLILELGSSPELVQVPGVEGEVVLGDPFVCDGRPARVPLPEGLGLRPDGRVEGSITGFSPSCPIRVAGVDLWMEQAELTVAGGSDPQVTLSGGARARFAAAGREIDAQGSVTLELPDVRITEGRLAFQGPDFSYAFPADEPLATFTIGDATLSPQGLTVDGRYELGTGQCAVPVTFDGFRVGFDGRIAAGRVLFDAGASAEATIGTGGTVAWRVTCPPLTDPLGTGARIELPAQVALTSDGLEARGTASARLAYEGRDLASIEADFSGSFALGTDPIAVASGRVDIRESTTPLGYFDRQGFHPNLTALAKNLVPDRLPLPTEQVAYLQLRAQDGSLNVDVQRSGDTVRITTPGQGTAPLVLPALRLGRVDTPTMNVALDLWIDASGGGILDGELRAGVPASRAGDFDLSGAGIPLAIDSLIYADDENGYAFRLAGRPVLPAQLGTTSGQVRLTIERTGRMVGRVLVEETGDMDLIPSGAVRLSYDTVALDIDADLSSNNVTWAVDVAGDLAVAPGTGQPYEVGASLRASPSGLSFSRISVPQTGGFTYFDVGPVRLGLGGLKVPSITHDPNTGWDFELWVDLSLEIPELDGYQLPAVEDVAISPDSFTIPAFELPNLGQAVSPVTLAGFQLKPLAFRMDSLTFDLLGGSPPSDWGMGFDFELSLGQLPSGAPPELRNLTLSVLDASLGTGGFTGTIETRLPRPGIRFPIGESGMEIELRELSGDLSLANGVQDITVDAEIAWTPPDLMVCGTSDPTFDLTGNTLTLSGDGRIAGRINDLAQPCPVELGPLTLELTGADLIFAAGSSDQQVTIDATGEARLPGAAQGDTITATGAIEMDLLAGRITNGSIAIAEPFRLAVPNDAPLFTFLVRQARLDTSGLTLSGGGDLRVGPNPEQSSPSDVSVSFNSLTLGLPTFAVEGGTVTFNSAFALDAGIGSGGLQWAVSDTASQPPAQPGLRLTLPLNATLGAAGLEIGGSSSAALAVADSLYPLLTADFQNQFRLGFDPARVDRGRVDLMLSDTRLAWVDSTGFNPDNVAGVLPIPARLALPSEDVAYLQLRDTVSNDLLVATSNEPNGVRLQTPANETVDLVVPSLQGQQASAPSFQISLDILIDPSTNTVMAGTVQVAVPDTQAQPLLDLARFGLPMEVRRLAYADGGQGYALSLDARLQLPESMDSVRVDFQDLTLDANGLSGEAKLGTFRQGWDPNQGPVVDAPVGGLTFEVDGARAVFGQSPTFELEGGLRMALFQGDGQQEPARLPFTADVSTGGVTLTADPSQLPNSRLPLGVATFEPTPIEANPAIAFTADAQEAALTLRGILRAPSLSSEFEVTVDGLKVGTAGVDAPDMSLSVPEEYMQFGLFGAEFTLQDVQSQDAIALSIQNQVLTLTMAGQLDFLDHTAEFTGLEVATDGTVGLASARLVDESIVVVDSVLEITSMGIANGALAVDLGVTAPAPYADVPEQTLSFSVAPDGTVSGGGEVVLLDEAQDVSNAQVTTPLVDAHLRYLAAELDLASQQDPGSVKLVGDLYVQGEAGNRIAVGDRSGNTVAPGLTIGFDGSVTWGAVSVARQFEFDFEVLAMTVDQAGVTQDGNDLLVGIGGQLAIDVPVVTGGIGFEEFRIGADLEPELSQFRVLQGDLTLAGMVSLSLNDFEYVGSPTTIQVTGGGMPQQAGDDVGTESVDVDVQSYISFGGSLGIGSGCGDGNQCIFSGGVKQFQFYRTQGGDVSLVVDSAHFAVQDVITMQADLRYSQTGSEFAIQVGAQATVMNQYGAVLVGAMDNKGPELSAGMFVAVQGTVPIVPGVLSLEGVGGGFFLNGKQSHIDLVRSYVNVPNLNSGKFGTPVGRFTGLLYADASIVSRQVVRARTLLTVSEAGMQIDGIAAILSPPNTAMDQAPLRGMMSLAVGWKQGFAEGNFAVVMDYSPIVTADQEVGFFIYGQDAWGIHGSGDITFVKVIGGTSEFVVGPPGFYVGGTQYASFSFWVIDVSASAEASVWRLNQPSEWGAYLSVMAKAELGPVSGRGRLRGVLIQRGSSLPYVYAGADARGCLGDWCKSASVWAKFKESGVSGGFGSDSDLEDAMDRAQDAKEEINQQAEEVANNADEARPQPGDIVVSDQMLTAAYDRLTAMNWWDVNSIMSTVRSREYQSHSHYDESQSLIDYYFWYADLLAETDAPELEVENTLAPQTIAEMSDSVTARLQRLESRQQPVYQRMSNLELEFEDLQQVASETWPESPVRSAALGPPVATTFTRNDTTYKRLDSGPTFDVDTAAAAQAQQDMEQREQETDALQQRVWDRIQQIQAGFDTLRAATADTAGNDSPLEFATLHGDVMEAAQMQYAYHGDFVMRKRDWLGEKLTALEGRESSVRSMIASKTNALEQVAARQSGTQDFLEELARNRARSLSDIMGHDSIINRFDQEAQLAADAEDPWYAEQADSLGIRLWYDLAQVGMTDAHTRATAEIDSVRSWASRRLSQLRSQHQGLTQDLDGLYREQAELAGALYDLYDRFSIWVAADTARGDSAQLAGQVDAARDSMAKLLETPSFDRLDVMSATEGYLVRDFYSWWGSHPSGGDPYEFLYDSRAGEMPVLGTLGMRSNGRLSSRKAYLLAPDTGTTQQNRTLRASLRAGAGYLQTRRVEYVAEFGDTSSMGSQNPVREFGLEADTTAPVWPPSVRVPGWSSATTAWVADSTSLGEVTWSSGWDPESSMSEFEYAIARTGPAASGPGSSCQLADTVQGWTSTGGRRKAQLLGLELTTDSAYWVLVRAYNAGGLASDCGVSQRIRYDATPPAFAGSLDVVQPSDTADSGLTPPSVATLNQRAYEACVEDDGLITLSIASAMESFDDRVDTSDTVRLRVETPTASDGESGLDTYYWAVADQPVGEYQGGSGIWTEHPPGQTLWIEGEPLTFRDSFYVSYVAVNRAGMPTDPAVYGPFQPADPIPPVAPKLCGDVGTNGRLRLEFESRGGDAETGRAGYRYRVRTGSGTVLRDWGGTDDLAPDSVSAGTVIATDSVGTPTSTPYYVDVMLRNGQDMRAYASTGPIQTDASPPPGLSVLYSEAAPGSSGTDVLLTLDVPQDPESGIDAIHWMLIDESQGGRLGSGQLQHPRTGQFTTMLELSSQLGMQPGQQYTLVLYSTNGAGLDGGGDHTTFTRP
ncbi:MAG: hypothetical protein R6U63_12700 [Longimicrobiales bacterium]